MEEVYFNELRVQFCAADPTTEPGKMMSSEAITHRGKVFAFFSKSKKMVFKLGKDFNPLSVSTEILVFSPFKNRTPLNGWFEVPFNERELWQPLAEKALNLLKQETANP